MYGIMGRGLDAVPAGRQGLVRIYTDLSGRMALIVIVLEFSALQLKDPISQTQ